MSSWEVLAWGDDEGDFLKMMTPPMSTLSGPDGTVIQADGTGTTFIYPDGRSEFIAQRGMKDQEWDRSYPLVPDSLRRRVETTGETQGDILRMLADTDGTYGQGVNNG